MGISGVNFGVAETGSVCICTNEGNGRLTTSLPRIHVAIMGIERLVPTAADLGVMLEVLGRSGTGQRLTVYTNILSGPRRGRARRTAPRSSTSSSSTTAAARCSASELAEILYCIRCGACLYACPVYQQIGGHAYGSVYSGPVGSVLTPALAGIRALPRPAARQQRCAGRARKCCPVRIDIPRMLLALRAKGVEAGESPQWVSLGMKVLGWIGTRPRLFGLAGRVAARVAGADGERRLDPQLPLHLAGLDGVPRLPRPGQGVVPGTLGEAARRRVVIAGQPRSGCAR